MPRSNENVLRHEPLFGVWTMGQAKSIRDRITHHAQGTFSIVGSDRGCGTGSCLLPQRVADV